MSRKSKIMAWKTTCNLAAMVPWKAVIAFYMFHSSFRRAVALQVAVEASHARDGGISKKTSGNWPWFPCKWSAVKVVAWWLP